jgi:hypothetical protein
LQSLAQRVWSPNSRFHVGDIAWGRYFAEVATGPNLTCTLMEGDQHVIDALEVAGYARQTAGPYFARHTIGRGLAAGAFAAEGIQTPAP